MKLANKCLEDNSPTSLKTSLKMLSDLRMEMSDCTARTQHSKFFLLFSKRLKFPG